MAGLIVAYRYKVTGVQGCDCAEKRGVRIGSESCDLLPGRGECTRVQKFFIIELFHKAEAFAPFVLDRGIINFSFLVDKEISQVVCINKRVHQENMGIQACKRDFVCDTVSIWVLFLEGFQYFIKFICGLWCLQPKIIEPLLVDP